MLKKKLNPIFPKNRKFVTSLQNWKKRKEKFKYESVLIYIVFLF